MIVPTIEATLATGHKRIGMIGTAFTVNSETYKIELQRFDPEIEIFAKAAPLLVPLVENNAIEFSEPILRSYVEPLIEKNIDSLILGCTHYPLFKPMLKDILPDSVDIISQDDILPDSLVDYLERHPEIDARIGKNGAIRACLTDVSATYTEMGEKLFGEKLNFEKVVI